MIVSTSGKFLLMTALADIVDSALLLYFSEPRTRSRNSTIAPIFQNLLLFMSVFYYVSLIIFEYCGNDSHDKTSLQVIS